MSRKSGFTPSIIHDLHAWDIEGDEMEVESSVTRSIIYELHS